MSASEWQSRRTGSIIKVIDRRPRGDASSHTLQVKQLANVVAGSGDASSFTAYSGGVAYSAGTAANPVVPVPPSFGEYGILTGFDADNSLYYPNFGITGDFTVEFFFKADSLGGYITICGIDSPGSGVYIDFNVSDGDLYLSGDDDSDTLLTVSPGVWYYFALTRSGTDYYYSVDGITAQLTDFADQDLSEQGIAVGDWSPDEDPFENGSISNFRVSNIARYTTNFTVPTLPLSADANTQLLLLAKEDAPFADSSSFRRIAQGTCVRVPGPIQNATGYPVISGFSTEDFYRIPVSSLEMVGDFTVECFVYVTAENEGFAVAASLNFYFSGSTFYPGNGTYINIASWENRWVHFAFIRSATTISLSIDGVIRSEIDRPLGGQLYIGDDDGDPFNGKLSNLRVSKIARYTTNFTPSFPLTLDANTTLLLTNGFYGPATQDVNTNGAPTFAYEAISYTPLVISAFSQQNIRQFNVSQLKPAINTRIGRASVNNLPVLSLSTPTISQVEGNIGIKNYTYTVTRVGTLACTVNFAVTGSGASPAVASDFAGGILPRGVVIFPVGGNTKTIVISVIGDTTVEDTKQFTVTLSDPVDATIGTATATGTIVNDDLPILNLSPSNISQVEGSTGSTTYTYTVTRVGTLACSVNWVVTGSGVPPAVASDFSGGAFPGGVLNFEVGDTTKSIVIDVAGDTGVEFTKQFTVTLSAPTRAIIGTNKSTGTIVNDDFPILNLTTSTISQTEGNTAIKNYTYTVTRTGVLPCTVNWAVTGSGTSPALASDFPGNAFPRGLTYFATGDNSKTIVVSVMGDTAVEATKQFTVTLSDPTSATIGTDTATGTIVNDDFPVLNLSPSISQAEGNAGTTSYTYTVTRTGTLACSVNWAVTGTGSPPAVASDFAGGVLPQGVLNFEVGDATKSLVVDVAGDTTIEFAKQFTVTLSAPTSATIGISKATGTIVNDDFPVLNLTPSNISQPEGNSGFKNYTYTVTRTGTLACTVNWAVTGSGSSQAVASDFAGNLLPQGVAIFGTGDNSKTIVISVIGDTTAEFTKQFTVTLSDPVDATIGTATATGTIVNDDGDTIAVSLRYNESVGESFTWSGATFARDTSLPNFSYTTGAVSALTDEVPFGDRLIGVRIEGSVTTIGNFAFEGCSSLTSVTIPSSVTSIGESAFENSGLTSITIPSSVTTISNYAFFGCTSLTSITIPSSITSIGNQAFRNCTSLTSITIPSSVTTIGDFAFFGCTSLTSVTLPSSVTTIGDFAFFGCTSLTSVTLPSSITSISIGLFGTCTSLPSITIPSSVTSIGVEAFFGCTSLTSVTLPSSITSIGESAFEGSGLTSITIPNSITSISDFAFYECTSLTSVTIGNSVTNIGERAFRQCTSLTSVTIPSSVTSIDFAAFSYCEALTSIVIPSSVTSIGESAFENSGVTTVTIANDQLSGISSPATDVSFFGKTVQTILPASPTILQYNESIGESVTWSGATFARDITLPNFSYTSSAPSVLTGRVPSYNKLIGVTFGGSVTEIGYRAFYDCTSLTSVTIPSSVTGIGESAFDGAGLTSVIIPNSIATIARSAFSGNPLASVTIPSSVTSIDVFAFRQTLLTSVTIPNSVTSIGTGAFLQCGSLSSVIIPSSVTSIGNQAFYLCTSLTSITIPNSVTSIGSSAFNGSGLTSITIPNSITIIDGIFGYCTSLTSVTIPNSVTSIGGYAFRSCTSLTSITIPNSVTSIDEYAFAYTALTSITIPSSVTTIGDSAFLDCASLTSITIPSLVTSIGTNAFLNSGVTTVTIANGQLSGISSPATDVSFFGKDGVETILPS